MTLEHKHRLRINFRKREEREAREAGSIAAKKRKGHD